MADKIVKLLSKLPAKQLRLLKPVIEQIVLNNLEGLDVKALKGHKGLLRVRVGNYRIIFTIRQGKEPDIIFIGKRDQETYKHL